MDFARFYALHCQIEQIRDSSKETFLEETR